MHANKFLRIVQEEAGLRNLDEAQIATQIVFDLLHHRISPEEAEDIKAQLPETLACIWEGGEFWFERVLKRFTPQSRFGRDEFLNLVNAHKTTLPASAERITKAVFYALQSQISAGEADDVAAQLPEDLRAMWLSSRPLVPYPGGGGGETEIDPPV